MRVLFAIAGALFALVVTTRASAHLMAAKKGTMSLEGANAYVVLSLPVSAFIDVDDDGDGRLDARELETHAKEIASMLESGLAVESSSGPARRATLDFTLSEHDDGKPAPSTHLVVLAHFVFAASPSDVMLRADVLARAPATESIDVRAHRGKDVEHVVLTPQRSAHAFFQPAAAPRGSFDVRRLVLVVALAGFAAALVRIVKVKCAYLRASESCPRARPVRG